MSTPGKDEGCLYLVATPIGNLEDITLRAIRVLREVDLVAAEDTRTARTLFARHAVTTPLVSVFDGNEHARLPMLLDRLRSGQHIALISEAGLPMLSDPGVPLIRACVEASIPIDVIPGPSAMTTALLLSGLGGSRFRFVGFLPRSGGARQHLLASIATDTDVTVLFESARRVERTMGELAPLLRGRPLALLREMTKLHQEVRRGTAAELLESIRSDPPRGEITLVIGERTSPASTAVAETDLEELESLVRERLACGQTVKEIARQLAHLGHGKRAIYQLALSLAKPGDSGDGS